MKLLPLSLYAFTFSQLFSLFSSFLAPPMSALEEMSTTYKDTLFYDGFESGTLNPQFWTARPGAANAWVAVEDSIGNVPIAAAGQFAVLLGKTDDNDYVVNSLDLHFDLSNHTAVYLSFWIADFYEDSHPEDGLYFSDNNGQSFTKVFNFDAANWTNSYGQFPPFPIHRLAASSGLQLNDQFIIRFQQGGSGDFNTYGAEDGLWIDEVTLFSSPTTYAPLPLNDSFEDPDLATHWRWAFPDQ
ncbi:MAG: hypothetical protein AAFP19_25955, partial [Bacteroidota bacterium]